jgi:hypothetical protein
MSDKDLMRYSLEPSSKKYSVDKYPESRFVTAIALRKGQPGVSKTPPGYPAKQR